MMTSEERAFWIDEGLIPADPTPRHDLTHLRPEWSDRCSTTVARKGEEESCDKPSCAAITGWFEGEWSTWAACAYHAHMLGGRENFGLVPLTAFLNVNPGLRARLKEAEHRVAEAEQGFPLGLWWEPDEYRPDPRTARA